MKIANCLIPIPHCWRFGKGTSLMIQLCLNAFHACAGRRTEATLQMCCSRYTSFLKTLHLTSYSEPILGVVLFCFWTKLTLPSADYGNVCTLHTNVHTVVSVFYNSRQASKTACCLTFKTSTATKSRKKKATE